MCQAYRFIFKRKTQEKRDTVGLVMISISNTATQLFSKYRCQPIHKDNKM